MIIGVLALQGDFAEHMKILQELGQPAEEVRTVRDLQAVDGLIIPGGESTVIGALMASEGLLEAIREAFMSGKFPILGTCAGAILLSKNVTGKNSPKTLGLLDITIERNAFGTQHQSSEVEIEVTGLGKKHVSLIRAPKILSQESFVTVLASHNGNPVLVKQGSIIASTFHPEVWGETWLHELFLRF